MKQKMMGILFLSLLLVNSATAYNIYDLCVDLNLTTAGCMDYLYNLINTEVDPVITYEQNINVSEIMDQYVTKSEMEARLSLIEVQGKSDLEDVEDELLDLIKSQNNTRIIYSGTNIQEKDPVDEYLKAYAEQQRLKEIKAMFDDLNDDVEVKQETSENVETQLKQMNIEIMEDMRRLIENTVMPQIDSVKGQVNDIRSTKIVDQATETNDPAICTIDEECPVDKRCVAKKCVLDRRNDAEKFLSSKVFLFANSMWLGIYIFLIFIGRVPDKYNVFRGFKEKKTEEDFQDREMEDLDRKLADLGKKIDSLDPTLKQTDEKDDYSP